MAKAQPADPAADGVNSTPESTAPAPVINADAATPENTPVPGGGRWRWDIALPGWVDVDATEPLPQPIEPLQE